ncbi:collagen-like protein [Pediococcus acidilactici]|uniref:collagen-like protein n=1 Tax=Pediococcus acidilactici TaxID=1254 RepID=UPI00132531A4|nr:collagen-like protein [Pediococcus acidilactici]KAF0343796.1 collagen-like protein [Pediococcus acidilactici]KAF0353615.1 collagen-like protein [Pediococcus acidilactici]KAF0357951.1 collagen-like protein [Pediococcus acidilactici]KAF0362113.1 collagen-like protein [Pediococcus acidilactici]KAF0408638.1 collagen-like protein [Pediococcus acidilactici]
MRFVKVLNRTLTKENDTAATYRVNLYDDLDITDLSGKTVDISIANAEGFIGLIVPEVNNPDIIIDLGNTVLNGLPAGSYFLEINVKDEKGNVAKYPTSGYVTLDVSPDLVKTIDSLVPQVTLNSILQAVNDKVAKIQANVLKGDKGDPGKDGRDGRDGLDGKDGKDGTNGVDGKNGKDGTNGLTPFLAWADSMDGSTNFSTTNYNLTYVGIAYSTDKTPPSDPHAYNWSLNAEPTVLSNNVIGAFDYLLIQSADGSVWREIIDNDGNVTFNKQ